ncbi:MAG: hypothetical protein LBJ15_06610 [Comamonas sp.]|jgi:opacity protein-like surface antigen|uniref:hypothetical protein n=1 Tax=Comamonas sp. TaxID=34028 RepID=UPI00281C8FC9|nr:hypothetical protein [Comamonas sp.]MDR0213665.1 hypothetical protein [Comamonas sp.]MDR2299109.1 hypothetical protein [Comamonas sp.]
MKPNFRWNLPLCLCAALLALLQSAAQAAPAPWYLWRSQLDGALTCQQFSPGQAWSLYDGPFADLACEKRVTIKR